MITGFPQESKNYFDKSKNILKCFLSLSQRNFMESFRKCTFLQALTNVVLTDALAGHNKCCHKN